MKRVCFFLAVILAIITAAAPAYAADGFYVVGAGGSVGVKISSLPKIITDPGFYVVTGNLSCPAGNGITVNSDNVTIDLMGFCLTGNSSSYGITGSSRNVEVRNGSLTGWDRAVYLWGVQNRIINLRIRGGAYGIHLHTNGGHLVQGCTVQYYSDTGIFATYSTISNNILHVATGADYGIVGSGIINGNRLTGRNTIGIFCVGPANLIGNNVDSSVTGNSGGGIVMSAVELWPTVLDQNTVYGPGNHYVGGTSATVWAGKSTFYPYGNNAGAP